MKLSKKKLASYSFLAFPLAALTLPINIFLPTFYAQEIGLGLASAGFILLIARLIDVFSDPLIGIFSDRTKPEIGRRKPWILGGLPLVMLAAWFLLVPLEGAGNLYLLGWSILLYISWTCMILPLNAWGAELSKDYDERTTISAWREGFTVAGVLGALSLVALFGASDDSGYALKLIAFLVIILTPVGTYFALKFVPEPQVLKKKSTSFRDGLKILGANRPFRRLIFAYLINGLANGLPATLFLIFVQYALGMKEQAGPLLFIYFLCGVLAVPFWSWLSKKHGKHRTWCYAMVWACIFFLFVPLVGEGSYFLFLMICITTGFSLGADLTLPASMQADVVDVDTLETGEQRTGLYFAMWSMVTKLSLALAAGIAFPLLEWSGFSIQNGGDTTMLIALYSLIPVALKIGAIYLMWRHPLNESDVSSTQAKIAEKWN